MATIEQELIEKIGKMDEEQQMRVLQYVQSLEAESQMTWDEWLEEARAFREQLRAKARDQSLLQFSSRAG